MTPADILIDAFGRIREAVQQATSGLSAEQLSFRVDPEANTIAWLVWHLTRVQDDHLADAFGGEQVWTTQGWFDRFGLPFDASATGYGQTSADVAAVKVPADLLIGYHEAVHDRTLQYLRRLTDDDLPRIVDKRWDPPVTLAVRVVSVIEDDLQHAGQAALIRGTCERAAP